jgi:hypothetical protein
MGAEIVGKLCGRELTAEDLETIRVAVRECWIGWGCAEREAYLGQVLNNARFLPLLWVQGRNLASKVLSLAAAQVPENFAVRYAPVWCCWRRSFRARVSVAPVTTPPTGSTWVRPPDGANATAPIRRACA